MAIVRWKDRDLYDPWKDMQNLQDEINKLFDFDQFQTTTGLFDRNISPPVDIVEGTHEFSVLCELPGMEQKDIDLSIASNVLTIKGDKKNGNEEKTGKYYRRESVSGSFQRTVPLPESVDPDKITAILKDGILTITLLKKEEAKPRQISVNIK